MGNAIGSTSTVLRGAVSKNVLVCSLDKAGCFFLGTDIAPCLHGGFREIYMLSVFKFVFPNLQLGSALQMDLVVIFSTDCNR